MTREPKSVLDLQKLFPDEQACLDYIEAQRWNGKPRCPRCESEKVSKFTTGKRAGKLWWCAGCRQQFTVKIGTIFEDSPIKLEKWFLAIYICSAHKKGIAARQLAKDIDVQIKTAWFMGHRIRTMMANGSMEKQLSGVVQTVVKSSDDIIKTDQSEDCGGVDE